MARVPRHRPNRRTRPDPRKHRSARAQDLELAPPPPIKPEDVTVTATDPETGEDIDVHGVDMPEFNDGDDGEDDGAEE